MCIGNFLKVVCKETFVKVIDCKIDGHKQLFEGTAEQASKNGLLINIEIIQVEAGNGEILIYV